MLGSEEEMVECPYDKAHIMLRKRLQQHLLKCRLQHPDVELVKCVYNSTHWLVESEYVAHLSSCPDRKLVSHYKYSAPSQLQVGKTHDPLPSDENWDDTDVPDYNPATYAKTAPIILKPNGATKSLRKEFIKSERKRLGDKDSDDDEHERKRLRESTPPKPPTPPPPIYSASALWERSLNVLDTDPYYDPHPSCSTRGHKSKPDKKGTRDKERSKKYKK